MDNATKYNQASLNSMSPEDMTRELMEIQKLHIELKDPESRNTLLPPERVRRAVYIQFRLNESRAGPRATPRKKRVSEMTDAEIATTRTAKEPPKTLEDSYDDL